MSDEEFIVTTANMLEIVAREAAKELREKDAEIASLKEDISEWEEAHKDRCKDWLYWKDQDARLHEENARLREALEPIVRIKAFTWIYERVPVEALRDDEEVHVKLTGAQIKKMRDAAIRDGGKDEN